MQLRNVPVCDVESVDPGVLALAVQDCSIPESFIHRAESHSGTHQKTLDRVIVIKRIDRNAYSFRVVEKSAGVQTPGGLSVPVDAGRIGLHGVRIIECRGRMHLLGIYRFQSKAKLMPGVEAPFCRQTKVHIQFLLIVHRHEPVLQKTGVC